MLAPAVQPPQGSPPELPTLTPEDAACIEAYFDHHRNSFALAKAANTSLHEVLAWAAQPHIRAYIDFIAKDLADGLKSAALQALRELLDKTTDPIEKRRCAQSILRGLNPPRPRASREPFADSPRPKLHSTPAISGQVPAPTAADQELHSILQSLEQLRGQHPQPDRDDQADEALDRQLDEELDEELDREMDEELDRLAEQLDPQLLADVIAREVHINQPTVAVSNNPPAAPARRGPAP